MPKISARSNRRRGGAVDYVRGEVGDQGLRPDQYVTLPSTPRPASLVVADFGCGDCRLASSVRNPVHCFDLASLDPRVTVCDMAQVSTSVCLAFAFSNPSSWSSHPFIQLKHLVLNFPLQHCVLYLTFFFIIRCLWTMNLWMWLCFAFH